MKQDALAVIASHDWTWKRRPNTTDGRAVIISTELGYICVLLRRSVISVRWCDHIEGASNPNWRFQAYFVTVLTVVAPDSPHVNSPVLIAVISWCRMIGQLLSVKLLISSLSFFLSFSFCFFWKSELFSFSIDYCCCFVLLFCSPFSFEIYNSSFERWKWWKCGTPVAVLFVYLCCFVSFFFVGFPIRW